MQTSLPRDAITARSGAEFRGLLKLIREQAGLSGGQVACISGIDRKVVYRLGYTRVSKLPAIQEQVELYVRSCRLVPEQVELVMDLWATLSRAGTNS